MLLVRNIPLVPRHLHFGVQRRQSAPRRLPCLTLGPARSFLQCWIHQVWQVWCVESSESGLAHSFPTRGLYPCTLVLLYLLWQSVCSQPLNDKLQSNNALFSFPSVTFVRHGVNVMAFALSLSPLLLI